MSSIHDALKKVQQSMQDKPSAKKAETPLPTLPSKERSNSSKTFLLVLFALVLLISVGYWIMVSRSSHLIQQQEPALTQPQSTPPVSVPVAENLPAAPVTPPSTEAPEFKLNIQGIMANGAHHIALINDKVYEEGAVIEGRKIIKISLNAVTIEYEGKQEEILIKK